MDASGRRLLETAGTGLLGAVGAGVLSLHPGSFAPILAAPCKLDNLPRGRRG